MNVCIILRDMGLKSILQYILVTLEYGMNFKPQIEDGKRIIMVITFALALILSVSSCSRMDQIEINCLNQSWVVFALDYYEEPNFIKEFKPGTVISLDEGQEIFLFFLAFNGLKESNGHKGIVKWVSSGERNEFGVWNVSVKCNYSGIQKACWP